jgi:nitroreductase
VAKFKILEGLNMDVIEAIQERRSTRGFLDKPVGKETLERLLHLATQAPSAINLQPWEFAVVSGEERKRLSRVLVKRMRERAISCGPGAKNPLPEYFIERQRGLLECMLPHLPENMPFEEFINEGSCNFYGAPTAIIILVDQVFSSARLTDIGIDDEIKEELSIPEEKQVVIGIAVGYKDPDAPVNRTKSARVPVRDVVRWRE